MRRVPSGTLWPRARAEATGLTRANGGAVTADTTPETTDTTYVVVVSRSKVRHVVAVHTTLAAHSTLAVDGVMGPLTIRALQIKIGAHQDGSRHLSRTTVAALQTYLNSH